MVEPPSLVGRTIADRYCIEELVGSGAMGDVYRARHVGLGSDVAVKIMRPSIAKDQSFKERFYREAKAASRLEHEHSVRVLDFGTEPDGLVYLAMEFLRGRDLLAILREESPLSNERIVEILVQTLAAIGTAHSHGIVHRDLKPENIMIVPDRDGDRHDCVKVCDFGIAKLVDARSFKSHEDVKTALTTGNALIGTPEYMSPEQARGEPLDARTDLYSLGVILYRMLTGRLPFDAENAIGIAVKHVMEEPEPPSRIVPGVHPRLEAICLRALRKAPADRHASAKDMRADLRAALGGAALLPTPAPSASPFLASAPGGAASHGSVPTALESAPTEIGIGSVDPRQAHSGSASLGRSDAAHHAGDGVDEPMSDALAVGVPFDANRRVLAGVLGLVAALGALGLAYVFVVRTTGAADGGGAGLVAPPIARAAEGSALPSATAFETSAIPNATAPAAKGSQRPGATNAHPSPTSAPLPSGASGAPADSHAKAAPTGPASAPTGPAPAPTPAPTAPAPTAEYRPSNALVSYQSLTASRVQHDAVARKMAELAPRMNACYRDALFMVGSPVGGVAVIDMSIDPAGHVIGVVTAAQLPAFQRCVSGLVSGLSIPASAVEAGGGTAEQTLKLIP